MSPERFETLIRQHDHTVVVALLAWGARLGEARELSHDAWARLWEQLQAGALTELVLPGLAIRQASFLLAERRRRSRRTEPVEVPHHVPSPFARVEAREQLERVATLLEACSPRAQSVMRSALDSDAKHGELAQREGLSLQRFRQVLCEVRARLRLAVEEDEP